MKSKEYNAFIADIYRYRPLIVVVLSILVMLPTLDEMVTQGLSLLIVLFRLAETMFVDSVVVWLVSSVLLRYARIQARRQIAEVPEGEFNA